MRSRFSNPLDCSRLLAHLVARRQATQLVHFRHHTARCHANPTIQCMSSRHSCRLFHFRARSLLFSGIHSSNAHAFEFHGTMSNTPSQPPFQRSALVSFIQRADLSLPTRTCCQPPALCSDVLAKCVKIHHVALDTKGKCKMFDSRLQVPSSWSLLHGNGKKKELDDRWTHFPNYFNVFLKVTVTH